MGMYYVVDTMILDNYLSDKRLKRNQGLREFAMVSSEIQWLENMVKHYTLTKKRPLIERQYFYKVARYIMNNYDNKESMFIEKQLEAYNCAYERLIDYRKLSRFQKIKQYLK